MQKYCLKQRNNGCQRGELNTNTDIQSHVTDTLIETHTTSHTQPNPHTHKINHTNEYKHAYMHDVLPYSFCFQIQSILYLAPLKPKQHSCKENVNVMKLCNYLCRIIARPQLILSLSGNLEASDTFQVFPED